MTLNRTTIVALLTALTLLALGCGFAGGNAGTDNRAGTAQVNGNGTPAQTTDQPAAALPMDGKTAQVYKDGLKVLVSAPTTYRVPAYAAGHTAGNTAITFKVTIINGTPQQADITMTTVTVAFGADGVTAEQIYADGLNTFPNTGKLAPGARRTLKLAFSADTKDTSRIDVTVAPGFLDYTEALFTGKIAAR